MRAGTQFSIFISILPMLRLCNPVRLGLQAQEHSPVLFLDNLLHWLPVQANPENSPETSFQSVIYSLCDGSMLK